MNANGYVPANRYARVCMCESLCTKCRNYVDVVRTFQEVNVRRRFFVCLFVCLFFFFYYYLWCIGPCGKLAMTESVTTDTVPVRFYAVRWRVHPRFFWDISARGPPPEKRTFRHTLAPPPSSVTRRKIIERYRIAALSTEENKSPTVLIHLTVYYAAMTLYYPATVVCVWFCYMFRRRILNKQIYG